MLAVDREPELLEEARQRAAPFPNVTFAEGDITRLDLAGGTFDLAGCARTLHHVRRPELAIAELARVTRFGGHVLVIDQIAPGDPLVAVELDRFERARDTTHTPAAPGRRRALAAGGERAGRPPDGVPRGAVATSTATSTSPAATGEARERAEALAPDDYRAARRLVSRPPKPSACAA